MQENLTTIITKLAQEAIDFANSCIKTSTTRPDFNQTDENGKIKEQRLRKDQLAISEMRALSRLPSCVQPDAILKTEPTLLFYIIRAAFAHKFSCGNCLELASIGFWYITEKICHNPNYNGKLKICLSRLVGPADHVFIIIKSKEDPELSYVCDPLAKQVYNQSEIYHRMKSFKGYDDRCYTPINEPIKPPQGIEELISSDDLLNTFSPITPLPNSDIINSALLRLMFKCVEHFSLSKSVYDPFDFTLQNIRSYYTEITRWIEDKVRDSQGGKSTCDAILTELMNSEMWGKAPPDERNFLTSLRNCLMDVDLTENSFFPGVNFTDLETPSQVMAVT